MMTIETAAVCNECIKMNFVYSWLGDKFADQRDTMVKATFTLYPNEQPCEALKSLVNSDSVEKLPYCKDGACYILDKMKTDSKSNSNTEVKGEL